MSARLSFVVGPDLHNRKRIWEKSVKLKNYLQKLHDNYGKISYISKIQRRKIYFVWKMFSENRQINKMNLNGAIASLLIHFSIVNKVMSSSKTPQKFVQIYKLKHCYLILRCGSEIVVQIQQENECQKHGGCTEQVPNIVAVIKAHQ